MSESTQKKLNRVRKPRVHITYDVETGGAMEVKELPFVVGVMGDFSGNPAPDSLPPMKDRKFVEIDRDNFDKVLRGAAPRLTYRVDDKLSGDENSQLNVELNFKSMSDFSPENVAKQVEPMRKLLETRSKLKDLLGRMEGNDKLESLLEQIIQNDEARDQLKSSLGIDEGSDGDSSDDGPSEEGS